MLISKKLGCTLLVSTNLDHHYLTVIILLSKLVGSFYDKARKLITAHFRISYKFTAGENIYSNV